MSAGQARNSMGKYLPTRPQPLGELVEALGGKKRVARDYRVSRWAVCSWCAGRLPLRLISLWRSEAVRFGLGETERFLADLEVELRRRRAVMIYVTSAVIFGFRGTWPVHGGGWHDEPPAPPQELTVPQIIKVKTYLEKHGRTLLRDGGGRLVTGITGSRVPGRAPTLDPIRAAQLQGFTLRNPRYDAERYEKWLREREKPTG